MPIKPELRSLYPFDLPQLSASIRFRRAKGRCEHCDRRHGSLVCHLGDGCWYDEAAEVWRDGKGRRVRTNLPAPENLPSEFPRFFTSVFLACAHLDHDIANNAGSNLAAESGGAKLVHGSGGIVPLRAA